MKHTMSADKNISSRKKRDVFMHRSSVNSSCANITGLTGIQTLEETQTKTLLPTRTDKHMWISWADLPSSLVQAPLTGDRPGTSPDTRGFLQLLYFCTSQPITFPFAFSKQLPCTLYSCSSGSERIPVKYHHCLVGLFSSSDCSFSLFARRRPSRQEEKLLSQQQQRVSFRQQEVAQSIS